MNDVYLKYSSAVIHIFYILLQSVEYNLLCETSPINTDLIWKPKSFMAILKEGRHNLK